MTETVTEWNWGIVCTVTLVGLLLAGPAVGPALGGGATAPPDGGTEISTNGTGVPTNATAAPDGTGNGTAAPVDSTGPETVPSGDSVRIAGYDPQTGNWNNYTLDRDRDTTFPASYPFLPEGTDFSDIDTPGTDYDKDSISERGATDQYPWSAVGSLGYRAPFGERSGCTGVVIESNHILTSAHCVFTNGGLSYEYEPDSGQTPVFFPGRSLGDEPFGGYNVTYVQTYKDWYQEEPDAFDMAVLSLNESIVDETGAFGYETFHVNVEGQGPPDYNRTQYQYYAHLTGYPARSEADYVDNRFEMWDLVANGQGTYVPLVPACQRNTRCHQFATGDALGELSAGGTSGGPVWQGSRVGLPLIMSVNKGTTTQVDAFSDNIGIRINENKATDIGKMVQNGARSGDARISAALVLDRSGSMSGSRLANAKDAAELYVSEAGDRENVAVVSYASGSRVDQSLTLLGQNNGRQNVRDAIDSIGAGGLTNVYAGLDDGLDELEQAQSADLQMAVLLSDGYHNTGPSKAEIRNEIVPEYNDRGYCLFTIAQGSGADEQFLEDIADSADCGDFFQAGEFTGRSAPAASDSTSLREIFEKIRQDVTDSDTIDDNAGTLGAGETTTGTVSIDSDLSGATFRVRITDANTAPVTDTGVDNETAGGAEPPQPVSDDQTAASTVEDVTLVDPSGDTVSADDADVGVSTVDDTVIYRIDRPEAGDWQYELANTDATERSYEVRVTARSFRRTDSLEVDVTDATGSAAPGGTVDVAANITHSGDGAVTKTAVLFAEGSRVDSQRVTVDGDAPTNLTLQWETTRAPAGNATVAVGVGVSSDATEVSIGCVERGEADRSTPDSSICPDKRDEDRNDDDTGDGRSASDPSGGDDRRDRGRSDDDRRGDGSSRGDGGR